MGDGDGTVLRFNAFIIRQLMFQMSYYHRASLMVKTTVNKLVFTVSLKHKES